MSSQATATLPDAAAILRNPAALLRTIQREVVTYYSDVFPLDELEGLGQKLDEATAETPFSALINGFGGDDALGLRYQIAHSLGVPECNLPHPDQTRVSSYTLGDAVRDLRYAAGLEEKDSQGRTRNI
jgi:hypothetical protein